MAKKDIYKLDRIARNLGIAMIVLAGLSLVYAAKGGVPWVPLLFLAGGVVLFLVGHTYYQKERKVVKLWDALDRSGEIKVDSLVASLGYPREFILQSLQLINGQARVYYVYEPDADTIVDAKLLSTFLVSADCQTCGRHFVRKVPLSFSDLPTCTHCGTPVAGQEVNKRKERVLDRREELLERKTGPQLKVGLMIFLVLFFWPGAVVYFLWYQNKKSEIQDSAEPEDEEFMGLK